jgi:hypothetical protein
MTNGLRLAVLTVTIAASSSPTFAQDAARKPIPIVIDLDSVDGTRPEAPERMTTTLINAINASREFRYLANPAMSGETTYLKLSWLTLKSVASSAHEAATVLGEALTYHAAGVPMDGILIFFGITECGSSPLTDCLVPAPLGDMQVGVKMLRDKSPALYDSLTK